MKTYKNKIVHVSIILCMQAYSAELHVALEEYDQHLEAITHALTKCTATYTANQLFYAAYQQQLAHKKLTVLEFGHCLFITAECNDIVNNLKEAQHSLQLLEQKVARMRPFKKPKQWYRSTSSAEFMTKNYFLEKLKYVECSLLATHHHITIQLQSFTNLCRNAITDGYYFDHKKPDQQAMYHNFSKRWPHFYENILATARQKKELTIRI